MKKEKDPAFLMYPEKFLAGTFFMTDEQLGRYIKLLCLQHQKGHLTTEQMSKVLHDDDLEVFEKFIRDDEGKWYNPKLDQEIEKRIKYSEYQSELANRRWNKDAKASAKSIPNDMPKDMPLDCPPTKNEDINTEYSSTIESNTPNHLFPNSNTNPVHNSLEDLYESL